MQGITIREIFVDSIRYWERRRVDYNLVLLLIVVGYFVMELPQAKERLSLYLFQDLFVYAVAANFVFCTAYLVDIGAQLTVFRSTWIRYRWVLFAIGLMYVFMLVPQVARHLFNGAT